MKRDIYKVLLVSQSGKGKTYSFRNMDPKTTGVINVEDKPLPFKNKFEHHTRPSNMNEAKAALKKYAEDNTIKVIVFDSLSSYLDMILSVARATKKKGYDIWNFYNEEVAKFLTFLKSIEKEVFVTAHYEWVEDEGGAKERRTKTKGREWMGTIEKEFTVVLFVDRELTEDKKINAWFDMALDSSSSKCPPDIFGEGVYQIPNDSNLVYQKILEFVK